MIATADEARRFAERVREYGLVPGVMIEIPAAALLADRILRHVEFLSIGTNDLAQYTMAADRMSADLAALTDPWQPGVIALVAHAAGPGPRSTNQSASAGGRRRPVAGLCADRSGRHVPVGGGRGGGRCRIQAGVGDAAAVPGGGRRRAGNRECRRGQAAALGVLG